MGIIVKTPGPTDPQPDPPPPPDGVAAPPVDPDEVEAEDPKAA